MCTHAAGVTTIVSYLLQLPVNEIEGTWPACLFCIERDSADSPWRLHSKYNGTHDHLSDASGTLCLKLAYFHYFASMYMYMYELFSPFNDLLHVFLG